MKNMKKYKNDNKEKLIKFCQRIFNYLKKNKNYKYN